MSYNSMIKGMGTVKNHEGEKAYAMTPEMELYTAVVTSALSSSPKGLQQRSSRCLVPFHVRSRWTIRNWISFS